MTAPIEPTATWLRDEDYFYGHIAVYRVEPLLGGARYVRVVSAPTWDPEHEVSGEVATHVRPCDVDGHELARESLAPMCGRLPSHAAVFGHLGYRVVDERGLRPRRAHTATREARPDRTWTSTPKDIYRFDPPLLGHARVGVTFLEDRGSGAGTYFVPDSVPSGMRPVPLRFDATTACRLRACADLAEAFAVLGYDVRSES